MIPPLTRTVSSNKLRLFGMNTTPENSSLEEKNDLDKTRMQEYSEPHIEDYGTIVNLTETSDETHS